MCSFEERGKKYRQNKTGEILFFVGIRFSAFGIVLNVINEKPNPFFIFSIPLMIIGIILLIASNFYNK